MSYYGATGTKRVYIDTSQPLWGLGSDPAPMAPTAKLIFLAKTNHGLMQAMMQQSEQSRWVLRGMADTGVVCLGADIPPAAHEGGRIMVVQALSEWANQGNWVVIRNHNTPEEGGGLCGKYTLAPNPPGPLQGWAAYKFTTEALIAIAGDPNAFVFMGPKDGWGTVSLNNEMIVHDIEAKINSANPPPVPPDPSKVIPPVEPPKKAGAGFLWPVVIFGAVIAAAYYFSSRDSEYEFEPNSWRC